LLLVDILASLWLTGGCAGARGDGCAGAGASGTAAAGPAQGIPDDVLALEATTAVVLAHVLTGDPPIDGLAEAGLRGLGRKLYRTHLDRTRRTDRRRSRTGRTGVLPLPLLARHGQTSRSPRPKPMPR
jgi:hypothetical protein